MKATDKKDSGIRELYFSDEFTEFYEKLQDKVWGIERSGFFNGREKWAKGFENQRV